MIRRRGPNSWQIRIDLGRDPATGKRLMDYRSFRGNKREAEAEERRLLSQRDNGTYVSIDRMTFAEFLDRWLMDVQTQVRPTTYDRYRDICRVHVSPSLGTVTLAKLKPLHLQNLYAAKLGDSGRADGRGSLSTTSVLHIHRVLHEALNAAVRWQLIGTNPAKAARPPRKRQVEMNVLTETDTRRMLDAASDTPLYYPILIAVTTGLRRGELLALRWRDVDLEDGSLAVCQTLHYSKRGLEFGEPKTKKSRRTVVLPSVTVKALREHRAAQSALRLQRGSEWTDHDLVFSTDDGRPWNPSSFSTRFRSFASKEEIGVKFHDLRHTHATHLFRAGIHPKMVSERLGHSTVGITLDLYTHVIEGMDRDAAERIDERFREVGIG